MPTYTSFNLSSSSSKRVCHLMWHHQQPSLMELSYKSKILQWAYLANFLQSIVSFMSAIVL